MLRSRIFWLMFTMMAMMSTGGLMVTSQFAAFARDFGVADAIVLGSAALPLALSFDRLMNGFCRPLFGWVSDHVGRENTMGLAFGLEACAIALMLLFRENPTLFVVLSGLVFFGWGEIFSLFPSTLADTFGEKHATTNYGFLYGSRARLYPRRTVRSAPQRRRRELAAGFRPGHPTGCRDGASCAPRPEAHAGTASQRDLPKPVRTA
jgi:MFS family permease